LWIKHLLLELLSYIIAKENLKNKKGSKQMKLKGLSTLGSAFMLSVSSLLLFALPGVAHATSVTLYWCNESATTADFNTASNWNTDSDCSSGTQEVPVSGDSLVFDNSNLANDVSIDNDITGLSLGSVTFQGSNSSLYGFQITDDGVSLSGGMTDTSNATLDSFETDITLTADQTFSDATAGYLDIGALGGSNAFNLGTYNLTVSADSNGVVNFDSPLSGSGQLITDPNQPGGTYQVNASSPIFSGNTVVNAGVFNIFYPNALGSGSIVVSDGASLVGLFSDTSDALANPITIGGDGTSLNGTPQGALNFSDDCPSNGNACANDGTITLSGPLTLTSDATVGASATTDVNGTVSGGYTLELEDGYSGPLNIGGTPAGTSGPSGSSVASTTAAPKTPDTGSALASSKVGLPLLGSLIVAGGLYIFSRRINHTSAK
jgi:hypothetical protein